MIFTGPSPAWAQSIIKGTVKDKKGTPVAYANVYIKNSIDGSVTDTLGGFTIRTNLKGSQVINASFIGYEQVSYQVILEDKEYTMDLILEETVNKLDEVVISAGTIEANNERKVAILKPLDIVTTAGAGADIVSAVQALPGVQRNEGDQTGMMVRGGDASESMIIIDGIVAQNAYYSNVPGVSQRSRFDPFQFKGTAFSSGGYSSRYGQALSSVLDLQTNDLPSENTFNIGMNLTGISLSGSNLMDRNAIEFSGTYLNLAPYFLINKSNFDYYKNPQGGSFSTRWMSKAGDKGMFKMNLSESFSKSGITIPDPQNFGSKMDYSNNNENTFFYMSYYNYLIDKIRYSTSFSFSNNNDNTGWGQYPLNRHDSRIQGRGEINSGIGKKLFLVAGTEIQRISYDQVFSDTVSNRFSDTQFAGYIESEWKPGKRFGLKTGIRVEYSNLLNKCNIAPRISAALKTGKYSQISAAAGIFYQSAPARYLLAGCRPGFQQAVHYIINYQVIRNDRTFRIEAYYKGYDQLIHEINVAYDPDQYRFYYGPVDNSGNGYAKGFDLFWRDKKTFKNVDYWISYSFIDTKRFYLNYPGKATPDFVSPHNLNIILKYFLEKIQTNISASYNYASGRTYYNPNSNNFLADKTPNYHNLSLGLSYLTTIKKMFTVIYLSVDNITNRHNILGYRYTSGGEERYPVVPSAYRTVFFGISLSLTKFNKDEL